MKIRIGTIQELTGQGYEILVDAPTRSVILAKFFDGQFIRSAGPADPSQAEEPTVAAQ